uniref:Pancreatic progenitor cell differentiation and proliferation factor n=1 Tax=Panthera leo TaxID=9689 RepID=A0A8C9CX30_PANLE
MSGFVLTAQNLEPHHLDSTSSNRSAEYPGDTIPHHPGLPKANLGHWWAGFFFGKSTLLFMATVLESLKHLESPQASSGTVTCDLALEAMKKQPHGQPGKANTGPPS